MLFPPQILPIKLAETGFSGSLFDALHATHWYRDEPAVRAHGLLIGKLGDRRVADPDIIFRRQRKVPFSLKRVRHRPRLLVTVVPRPGADLAGLADSLERGVSHLLVGTGKFEQEAVILEFIYALVHDFALHEIAWILEHSIPGADCLVLSNPAGNQALRLSSVMRDLADAVRAGRYGRQVRADSMVMDFSRETRGLTTMARFLAEVNAPPDADGAAGEAPARAPDRKQNQEKRKVDVSMDSYDMHGVASPLFSSELRLPLRRGWRYRLRVHIGEPNSYTSAMVGDIPSIDDVIPPDLTLETRTLEVVVYPKRFELLSPAVQALALPSAGNSAPVSFELRTPQEAGPAELRIAVYLNNNLLQSFVLDARIDGEYAYTDKAAVRVRLDSSGIAEFEELAHIAPRALSVALNDDRTTGSHTLMIKGEGLAKQVPLYSETMNEKMDEFREILESGTDFKAMLRSLASLGSEIRDLLNFDHTAYAQALDVLVGRRDATLQFVRHHDGRPFPWQTVYDYRLPTGQDFVDATICLADRPAAPSYNRMQVGCPHHPNQNVICIEGFWLARHRLELLSEQQHIEQKRNEEQCRESPQTARALRACAPPPNPLVTLGIGTPSGVAEGFRARLQERLGADLCSITPADAPVTDLLWDLKRRPAILVVLSHLYPRDKGQHLQTRLLAFEKDIAGAHISVSELSDRQVKGLWGHPHRPLVLLMACESARKDTGELIGLMDAFLRSGAAAVVGTEWKVDTATVTSFAEDIVGLTLGQPQGVALGTAIQHYARSRLAENSIAPFIFTTYGSADLQVGRP